MDAYTGFAEVYDLFMDNVPYDQWKENVLSFLRKYGIEDGLLLDLACGTGKMTRRLAKEGYDMIGVDLSEEMLAIAMEASAKESMEEAGKKEILYLCQDMREFELYGTVRGVVSLCDSMNYILEESDLKTVFSLVNNYLDPKGIFIFDMNSDYKYRDLLGNQTIVENREEGSFIWENYYDEESQINEYDMTFYVKDPEAERESFHRVQEVHLQRAYSMKQVKALLEEAGMKCLEVLDAETLKAPVETTERWYFIAQEQGK